MPHLTILEANPSRDSLEPNQIRLNVDLAHLRQAGAQLQRFNLQDHPEAFAARRIQPDLGLPAFLVDGRLVAQNLYPSRQQLAQWAGVSLVNAGGCGGAHCVCGGGSPA